jgi:uncharacterized membrane protein
MSWRPGVAAALLFAAAGAPVALAADVSDDDVLTIMRKHCVVCHARTPSHPSFDAPPKDVALETVDDVRAWGAKVIEQVVQDRNMPIGNSTGMTEEERQALARWVADGR